MPNMPPPPRSAFLSPPWEELSGWFYRSITSPIGFPEPQAPCSLIQAGKVDPSTFYLLCRSGDCLFCLLGGYLVCPLFLFPFPFVGIKCGWRFLFLNLLPRPRQVGLRPFLPRRCPLAVDPVDEILSVRAQNVPSRLFVRTFTLHQSASTIAPMLVHRKPLGLTPCFP